MKLLTRLDGWLNLLTGLGLRKKDPTVSTTYGSVKLLDQQSLHDIYRGDGLGRKIIDQPSKDMWREGFKVEGDSEGLINKHLFKTGISEQLLYQTKMARLFGGAIGVIGMTDGGTLDTPVNEGRIDSVDYLRVYDRHQIWLSSDDINDDPENSNYGQPEFYQVTPLAVGTRGSAQFRVHHSRILRMDGNKISEFNYINNNYWHDSVLQCVFNDMVRIGEALGYSANLIRTLSQTVLKINNLASLLMSEDGEALIKKRLDILDLSRGVMNMMMIDENEDFDYKTNQISGLTDVLMVFFQMLSGSTGIPMTILLGQSPGGLNATGESDLENYYDTIEQEQTSVLKPALYKLVRYILLSKKSNITIEGVTAEEFEVCFNPLWQMSDKELAEIKKINAETDNTYINAGVLAPDTVGLSRFEGDSYGKEINLELGSSKAMLDFSKFDPDEEQAFKDAEIKKVEGEANNAGEDKTKIPKE
jgi:phage-related protein (TIGR01555 family)